MKKFLLLSVFLFLFTSCNDPLENAELLPVEKAEVKEVDVTGMVGEKSRVNCGVLPVTNSDSWDFMSSDGKLLRGDYPFKKQLYLGLGRFFVKENEDSGYIMDYTGKVIADNFAGRPIISAPYGFHSGLLAVLVKRQPKDTVLKFGGVEKKAKGDAPVMYSREGHKNSINVYGTIDRDGNIHKDGNPIIFGYIDTKEGFEVQVSCGSDERDVAYYHNELKFGLYDTKKNLPITRDLYSIPILNSSSGDESGSFAAMTKNNELLWLNNRGDTILDIGETFPELGKELKKDIVRAYRGVDVEGFIFSFASKDALILKSSKKANAMVIGKEGKALSKFDANKVLDVLDFAVELPGKYRAYKNHKGKWGVLKDDLKVVVEPLYDDITSVDKNCFVGVRGEKTFLCTIVE